MQVKNAHQASRRSFIRNISFASVVLLNGIINPLSAASVFNLRSKVLLRLVVASDAHYGQPDTPYEALMLDMISKVNQFHQSNPLDFTVINGDIIHNEKRFLPEAKEKLTGLNMPWYVTRGNHDMVTEQYWKDVFGTPLNNDFVTKNMGIILGDTSNEKGVYLSPDLVWLKEKLEAHKHRKQVLLFLHIPQAQWTKNGISTPEFFELIRKYPNIKAVFHGHEHDQDGVTMDNGVPFFFDAHIGGNWGTKYKGFRVVELMKDGTLITYMMNPTDKMNEVTI